MLLLESDTTDRRRRVGDLNLHTFARLVRNKRRNNFAKMFLDYRRRIVVAADGEARVDYYGRSYI